LPMPGAVPDWDGAALPVPVVANVTARAAATITAARRAPPKPCATAVPALKTPPMRFDLSLTGRDSPSVSGFPAGNCDPRHTVRRARPKRVLSPLTPVWYGVPPHADVAQ